MTKPPIACVVWDDAHGNQSMFTDADVEHRPYRFSSVGFLVRSDEIGISLAREVGEDGAFRDHEFIPRIMVIDEWVIGPLKKPRARRQSPVPAVQT